MTLSAGLLENPLTDVRQLLSMVNFPPDVHIGLQNFDFLLPELSWIAITRMTITRKVAHRNKSNNEEWENQFCINQNPEFPTHAAVPSCLCVSRQMISVFSPNRLPKQFSNF